MCIMHNTCNNRNACIIILYCGPVFDLKVVLGNLLWPSDTCHSREDL